VFIELQVAHSSELRRLFDDALNRDPARRKSQVPLIRMYTLLYCAVQVMVCWFVVPYPRSRRAIEALCKLDLHNKYCNLLERYCKVATESSARLTALAALTTPTHRHACPATRTVRVARTTNPSQVSIDDFAVFGKENPQ